MNKTTIFWILLGGNILVSVILPIFIFPKIDNTMVKSDQIISGFIIAIFLFLLEVYIYISNMYNEKKEEKVINELESESSRRLFSIDQFVKQIIRTSYPSHDLFKLYLDKVINNLFDLASSAVSKNEIKIEDNMIEITEEMYFSAFTGDANSVFRPMYMCDDNEFFFESFGKNYFMVAKDLVDKRKIKMVKRLFIYKNQEEMDKEQIKKLIFFHNTTQHYECKVLSFEQYNHIKDDCRLSDLTGTFAVYGSRYLYTEKTVPTVAKVIGYYSKDVNTIKSFTNFFDRCWKQGNSHNVSSQKKITIDNIFDKGWNLC